MKKEIKPGDFVKFVGAVKYLNPTENLNNTFPNGVVLSCGSYFEVLNFSKYDDVLTIFSTHGAERGKEFMIHRRQVTHVKRKKEKPFIQCRYREGHLSDMGGLKRPQFVGWAIKKEYDNNPIGIDAMVDLEFRQVSCRGFLKMRAKNKKFDYNDEMNRCVEQFYSTEYRL